MDTAVTLYVKVNLDDLTFCKSSPFLKMHGTNPITLSTPNIGFKSELMSLDLKDGI
jgi:hypothetical protein